MMQICTMIDELVGLTISQQLTFIMMLLMMKHDTMLTVFWGDKWIQKSSLEGKCSRNCTLLFILENYISTKSNLIFYIITLLLMTSWIFVGSLDPENVEPHNRIKPYRSRIAWNEINGHYRWVQSISIQLGTINYSNLVVIFQNWHKCHSLKAPNL